VKLDVYYKSKNEVWSEVLHSFSRVEGVRLHWAELGRANGTVPLVLLHGLNDSHLTWKHVAPALAHNRRVLMPDLPGHGMSERPDASYELGWHAHLIAKWFEQIGVELADVVGHSYGGGVAQMLLLECPARVRRLVLVASGGLGREIGIALRLATIPQVVEFFGQPFMAVGTRLALRGSGYSKQDIAETCAMIAKPGSARAFARAVRDIADWRGQRKTFYQRANELRALPPIAVVWGDRDTMIPITHGKAFAESAEGVVFKPFPNCSHYLHHDRPDLFVAALREFLDTPTVPPARLRAERSARSV
jgi:pimeloyl-ACP methyl ester carboxylesterase